MEMETVINIDLDEFARIMRENFGIDKDATFYKNLAKTGRLKTAFKEGSRWKVKLNVMLCMDMTEEKKKKKYII